MYRQHIIYMHPWNREIIIGSLKFTWIHNMITYVHIHTHFIHIIYTYTYTSFQCFHTGLHSLRITGT